MTHEVFALKYRPQKFDQVTGQEITVRILKNALSQGRLHHAYLFTGPRGVGKTTLARIFAKALNCNRGGIPVDGSPGKYPEAGAEGYEKGPTPAVEPCNECVSCREITEGISLSVMEIDGASNTGVDDVRDLRERVRYLPPGGRYKVYIIDEVHMLSTAAFNALLKTLEEPPPHVIFIFATTEPQKIPVTVLSRVIRFDLRPITLPMIVDHLKKIAGAESVQAESDALFLIAREAGGGLRDALSLLDQVVSFSGKKIGIPAVEEVIGVSTRRYVLDLIRAVLGRNPAQVLKSSESAFAAGLEMKRLALDLLEYFRHLLVVQVSQDPALFDIPQEDLAELKEASTGHSPEELDRLFQILHRGIADLLRSPLPKVLFDILLLRLCQFEGLQPLDEILKMLSGGVPSLTTPTPRPPPPLFKAAAKTWPEFLTFLRSKKPQLYSMIEQGRFIKLGETEIRLGFPPQSIHLTLLQEEDRATMLKDLCREFFGHPLDLRLEAGSEAEETNIPPSSLPPIIDEAIQIFGAKRVEQPKRGPS